MRKNINFSQWCKDCPDCGNKMYYSTKYKLNDGVKSESVCKTCKYKKISRALLNKPLSPNHKNSLKKGWEKRKSNNFIPSMLGKHHSEKTKIKMCLSKQTNPPFLGKRHSEETKKKIIRDK